MTAAAAFRNTKKKSNDCYPRREFKVKAATKIYGGTLVMLDSNGWAVPAAAAASNKGVCGVAERDVDNSAGANGDLLVICEGGRFKFNATSLAQSQVGSLAFASDDNTFSATQGSNEPYAGVIDEYISATEGWLLVDPAQIAASLAAAIALAAA